MGKENTDVIKGIFVILVILSHASQYIQQSGIYDEPYMKIQGFLGQMIVSMFLFYSGYGILESIKKNGYPYIRSMPRNRILKTLVNFDIAIIIFLIFDAILKISHTPKTILLSFIGWESVENSNWYILCILALYVLTFVAFLFTKWSDSKQMLVFCTILLTLFTIGFVFFEMKMGKQSWYYNTAILFPLGCWYSLLQPYINRLVLKNDIIYTIAATVALIVLYVSYQNKSAYGIKSYTIWACAFTLVVVIATMKIQIKNVFLCWFGKHIFSIYIFQRIPMIALHRLGIAQQHKYFFVLLSVLMTLCIAQIFDALSSLLWKKLMPSKNASDPALKKESK